MHNSQSSDNIDLVLDRIPLCNLFPPPVKDPEALMGPARKTIDGKVTPRRPQNAFFIFRQNVIREAKRHKIRNMRTISKAASSLWKKATNEQRRLYQSLASEVAALHRQLYPDFKYSATKRRPRSQHVLEPSSPFSSFCPLPFPYYPLLTPSTASTSTFVNNPIIDQFTTTTNPLLDWFEFVSPDPAETSQASSAISDVLLWDCYEQFRKFK